MSSSSPPTLTWPITHVARREALLRRITSVLGADERFVAAWLTGSLGRGEADACSDIDLYAVVVSPHVEVLCAQPWRGAGRTTPERLGLIQRFGVPIVVHEAHVNAPEGGTQTNILFEDGTRLDFTLVPADYPALWPLLCGMSGADRTTAAAPLPADVAARLAHIHRRPEHFVAVASLADTGSALIGYAWVQDYGPGLRHAWSVARLHDLFVAPSWRRRGAGRRLFAAVWEWAARRGTVRYLEWQASLAAVPFYERLGFTGDTRSDLEEHPYFEIRLDT